MGWLLLIAGCIPVALAADVEALLAGAVDDWNAGKLTEARAQLDQAVAADGSRTDSHLLRGQVRYEQGDITGARKELSEVFAGTGWKTLADEGRAGGPMGGVETLVWEAGGVLVLANVHDDQLSDADQVLAKLKVESPRSALLAYAEVELLIAHDQLSPARTALDLARRQFPDDENLASAAADLGTADWASAYNIAVDKHNGGQDKECLAALPTNSNEPKVLSLGYTCAVGAGDLATAEARLKTVGAPNLPATQVLAHAVLRSKAGDPSAALSLLKEAKGADPKVSKTLEVRFLGEAGRGKDAIPLLSDPAVDPKEAQNVAARLVNEQDYGSAKKALEIVCPRVGAADRVACDALLQQVTERIP